MPTKEDIVDRAKREIWGAGADEGGVALYVQGHYGSTISRLEDVDKVWLLKAIQNELESKRLAEQSWPTVTDFDRLDRVFTMLEAQGIIALHRAGFTHSDGHEEVEEAYNAAGRKNSGYKGYCFYTEQDQEDTLERNDLYIAFGHLLGNGQKSVEVGKLLSAALEREGFQVDWDGTSQSRVIVKQFLWQRRTRADSSSSDIYGKY